ncbi:MAG: oxidoreductase, partial [Actinobacteria bacterium]|nr:oxidoreductase [Actinomycetota bacterium]
MGETSKKYGLLVNFEFCTGCHSCEVACKKYLNLPKGEFGIKVTEVGPYQYAEGP